MFNNIKFISFLILLFSIFSVEENYAQTEAVAIKNSLLRLPNQQFYLDGIMDGRIDKSEIGFFTKGPFNKRVPANFAGSLEDAFSTYFNFALTKDITKTPIVMKVTSFKISERQDGSEEIGKAEIEVIFYVSDKDKLAKVFQTDAIAEEKGSDITLTHERRIRKVLENVFMSFNNSAWKESPLVFEPLSAIKDESVTTKFVDNTGAKNKWNSLIAGHAAFGTNAEGWGVSYYGFKAKESGGWFLTYSASYDNYTIDPGLILRKGYTSLNLNYGKIGVGLMRRIGEEFHFAFNTLVPIGFEKLTKTNENGPSGSVIESNGFVLGIEPQQCFYFITKSKVSLVLGAGIYERFTNSKVYNLDIGLRIEAGIKF
jgi:hypothetical protein